MKIRAGDMVKVIRGKDIGKSSVVEKVYKKKGKVLVKGVNEVKKHLKVNEKGEGGITVVSMPLDVSKLMVVCPNCGKSTRVGYNLVNGKKIRVCKKCTESLDKKVEKEKTKDSSKKTKATPKKRKAVDKSKVDKK